jgi:hypothetical protein
MKWTVVILLVLVLVILWTTRKTSEYSNPITLDDISSIVKPGGVSVSSMGLKGAQFLASGSLTDLNVIVNGIPTNGWYITPFSSVPTFNTDSGSLTYRVTARAIAYAPLMMQYLCSNVGISAAGSATPQQAAGVFLDMFNLGVLGQTSVNVSNMNGAIGSNTPFASQQDFINRFNKSGAFDASVVYLLGFILGGFNRWLSGITFDTSYQPKPLGSSLTGSGAKWYPGQYIVSPSKTFFTIMQDDGNFVTAKGSGPSNNQGSFWSFGVTGIVPGSYALLQTDGNFVVMKPDDSAAVWRASSNGGTGPWTVALDDNGTLIVKDSTTRVWWQAPAPGPTWTSQGCFTDSDSRPLPNKLADVTSIKECEDQAIAAGYNVYGVEYDHECWAGTNVSYDALGPSTACANGRGGTWAFNAYTGPGYTNGQKFFTIVDSSVPRVVTPTDYSSQSSPSFTIAFGFYIVTPPTNWMTIFEHGAGYTYGGHPAQRHPSIYLTGGAQNNDQYLSKRFPQPIQNRLQIIMAGKGGAPGSVDDNKELFSRPLDPGGWYKIAFTVGQNVMKLYVGGSKLEEVSGNFTWANPEQPWKWFPNGNENGGIVTVRNATFWPRVLSSTEIANIPSS